MGRGTDWWKGQGQLGPEANNHISLFFLFPADSLMCWL